MQGYTRKSQHFCIRHKLARWHVTGLPRTTAEEFQKFLQDMVPNTPPRVRAAILSTAWSRWATERRLQRRDGVNNKCIFNCKPEAEDSIEHYQYCTVIREAHWRHLRLQPDASGSLLPAWVLGRGLHDKQDKTRAAIGVYATYRLYNDQKFNKRLTKEALMDAFGWFAREGVLRHPKAEETLMNTWARR